MSKLGRPLKPLSLTDEERRALQNWARRPKTAQRLALRARTVLACVEGPDNGSLAARLGINRGTVGERRRRFLDARLDGLAGEPRPGAPRTITDAQAEDVIARILETKPEDATHWSTRSMARRAGLSQTAVSRAWRAFGLEPHPAETFKLSTDPLSSDEVRDVVGLYLAPPERALVPCVDEEGRIQALDRTQPVPPTAPGTPERRAHDCVRHGTTSLLAALDVATGKVIGKCLERHRAREFIRFLDRIEASVERGEGAQVRLILGNYGTHKTAAVRRWFLRHPEYHLHSTPTGGSWLNLVERFSAEITTRRIRRGVLRSVAALERATRDYLEHRNADPEPSVWTASADLILDKVKKVCERTSNSGH